MATSAMKQGRGQPRAGRNAGQFRSAEIQIHRSQWPEGQVTRVPAEIIHDTRLGLFTLGVLMELLSRRDEWPLTAADFWREAEGTRHPGEGRDVYRRAFRELEAAGYADRFGYSMTPGHAAWVAAREAGGVFPPGVSKHRTSIPPEIVQAVRARDGYRCVKCGSTDDLTIGHIIPVVLGGSGETDNIQVECWSCNIPEGNSIKQAARALRRRRGVQP